MTARTRAPSISNSADSAHGEVYFRFTDAHGREHIVNTVDRTPDSAVSAQQVVLERPAHDLASGIDGRSFGLGLGVGILAGLLGTVLLRGRGPLARVLVLAVLGVVGMLAYLGWIRRTSGLGSGANVVATPRALVEDAKQAVDKMNAATRAREEEIKRIQQESK